MVDSGNGVDEDSELCFTCPRCGCLQKEEETPIACCKVFHKDFFLLLKYFLVIEFHIYNQCDKVDMRDYNQDFVCSV